MRDEVDELVEAWARERGDLDLAPVAVFSRTLCAADMNEPGETFLRPHSK